MKALEARQQRGWNFARMGTQRGQELNLLKPVVTVGILLLTFTLPTVGAHVADITFIPPSHWNTTEDMMSPASLPFTTANGTTLQRMIAPVVDDGVYPIVIAAAISADPNYSELKAAELSFTNTPKKGKGNRDDDDDDKAGTADKDVASITVNPISGLTTTEAGGTATFTVALNTLPKANVTIGLSSSNTTKGTVSPTSLTFTSANGMTPQTVTVTGVNDSVVDGNVAYTIITAPATSADRNYNGRNAVDVSVTNTDNDVAVPNVVGLTPANAQTAITTAGLTVGPVTTSNSPTVPVGRVISQTPTAGASVVLGAAVALLISAGPPSSAVPNVVGLTEAAAATALTNAGLTVGTVTTAPSETVPAGNVISQTPVAGVHVSPASAVALVISFGPPAFLMGVQNDPNTGPLVNSLYRIRTDGVVTKIGDLNHRTHGLAFVGSTLYSVEEQTLSTIGTPPKLHTLNPDTGVTLSSIPLSLSTGEGLEGGRGLATEPGTNQLWALLIVPSEVNTFRRLATINPITGLATQIAKIPGRFVDMAFDAAGTLYAITDNFPSTVHPARIYTLNKTTGEATEFLDVSAGAVAGQPNFRESETIGTGFSSNLLYHLSGQNKVTACCTKNILFETIHLTTKVRTPIPITVPSFFVTTGLTLVPPDSSRRALWDLDGNGKADLVWRNTGNGVVAVWLMNGTVIASTGFPAGVPSEWQIVGVGDVNGDGKADLIWRNSTSGTVAVWLMNGISTTSIGFPGTAPTEWAIQAIGDVNGDGKTDLVWRNTSDGNTAIWLMNGTTLVSTGFPGVVSSEWQIAGAGDVNGDGKADLIWRNSTSGTVAVWLMNGISITSLGFPGTAPTEWAIQAIGDVNGDGKTDLVWRNTSDGNTAIWLMNGTTLVSTGFPGVVSSEWQLAGMGDVNGDGKADLVWHNGISGTVAIWLMNGVTITSVGFPASISSDWEIQ